MITGRRLPILALVILASLLTQTTRALPPRAAPSILNYAQLHFATLEIFVDSGPHSLAAYQIEIAPPSDSPAAAVGITGGDHPAFAEPPFYDPAALNSAHSRLILAAFSTAANLPSGRTRVASIAIAYNAPLPAFAARLITAAGPDGRVLSRASVSVSEKNPSILMLQPQKESP